MTRALVLIASACIAAGCTSSTPPSTTPSPVTTSDAPPAPMVRTSVLIGNSFTPRGDAAAIKAFKADVAPVDSGGECNVTRTSGSGATIVSIGFPQRKNAHTTMSIMFDSVGHLIRFSERRGATPLPPMTGFTDAQRDSVMRANMMARRTTSVSFDYAIDQAVATNMGGDKPTEAIISTVRALEHLESLGDPRARLDRARKLCGV